jgi:hypothetical protein
MRGAEHACRLRFEISPGLSRRVGPTPGAGGRAEGLFQNQPRAREQDPGAAVRRAEQGRPGRGARRKRRDKPTARCSFCPHAPRPPEKHAPTGPIYWGLTGPRIVAVARAVCVDLGWRLRSWQGRSINCRLRRRILTNLGHRRCASNISTGATGSSSAAPAPAITPLTGDRPSNGRSTRRARATRSRRPPCSTICAEVASGDRVFQPLSSLDRDRPAQKIGHGRCIPLPAARGPYASSVQRRADRAGTVDPAALHLLDDWTYVPGMLVGGAA